jgi:Right handed beta helix region
MNRRFLPLLIALASLVSQAHAETFVVTRVDDPVPDTCQQADCSLREAAIAATGNDPFAGTDRIELAAGTYTLIRGALSHDDGLELVGAGSTQTFVVTDVALFGDVNDRTLTLRGMSLQNTTHAGLLIMINDIHLILDDIAVPAGGGTITISDTSDLEASDSDLRGTVTCGQSDGSCTLVDTQLVRFVAYPHSSGDVGPIVLLQRTTIDGQLDPSNPSSGLVLRAGKSFDIQDSDIVHTALGIKVLFHESVDETPPVTLRRVRYFDNAEPIYTQVPGQLRIFDSEFRDNPKRAILVDNGADVSISGSTFANNQVDGNAGGAILIEDNSVVSIQNSTFSGNTFTAAAAQAGARGGIGRPL